MNYQRNALVLPIGLTDLSYLELAIAIAFAAMVFLSTSGSGIFLLAGLVIFLLNIKAYKYYLKAGIFQPLILLLLFFIVHGLYIFLTQQADIEAVIENYSDWLQLLLFIPLACFLTKHSSRAHWFVLAGFCSFLVSLLIHKDFISLLQLSLNMRSGFGKPAIVFGLYSATFLLGMICFMPALDGYLKRHGKLFRLPALGCWAFIFFTVFSALIASQSRGAYLAFIIGLTFVIVYALISAQRSKKILLYNKKLVLLPLIIMVLTGLHYQQTIVKRIQSKNSTVRAYLNNDSLPNDSIGLRLNVWQFGLQKWQEKPLLGWGAGSAKHLIEGSEHKYLQGNGKKFLRHFHNSYIQLLVNFGLLGFCLFILLFYTVVREILCSRGFEKQQPGYYYFSLGSLLLLLVWCQFDFRMVHADWRFYWITLMAIICSRCIGNNLKQVNIS